MKISTCLVAAAAAATFVSTSTSAASAVQPSSVAFHQDQPGTSDKTDSPGKAKGHDKKDAPAPKPSATKKPTAKATGKPKPKPAGHGTANGHDKTSGSSGGPTQPPGKQRSRNENKKVTFCHVPPGNPANGHLITTSVNAIEPGHTHHAGDIIPPFTYVKHGSTITFPGQNWDAVGRATLANGCKPVSPAASGSAPGSSAPGQVPPVQAAPVGSNPGTGETTSGSLTHKTASSLTDVQGANESLVDRILPNTGGARLLYLVLGVALLGTGLLLVTRRRRTV